MKEEVLRLLQDNPARYYCCSCISRILRLVHTEVANILPSFVVTHPKDQSAQGRCAECGALRTVFRYMPSTGV